MDSLTAQIVLPVWGIVAAVLGIALTVGASLLFYCRQRTARGRAETLSEELRVSRGGVDDLRESEALYRHLYEQAPVGIFRTAIDGSRVLMSNEAAATMFGYPGVEEFLEGCRPAEVYVDPAQRQTLIERLRADGGVTDFEILVRRPDGSKKYLSLSGHLHTEQGYLEGALIDVTARRRAERELKDSHLFLQIVMETIPNPLFYRDISGVFRHVNPSFEQFTGLSRTEIIGRRADALMPPENAEDWSARTTELLNGSGGAMHRFETWVRTREGGRRVIVIQEGTVPDSAGRRIGLVGVATDVTEFKRVESELRSAWATFRNIFDNAVDGIFTSTVDGRFVRANRAMAETLGYDSPEELIKSVTDIGSQFYARPEQRDEVLRKLSADGALPRFEVEARRRDGETVWVSLSMRGVFDEDGKLTRIEGVAADVSERMLKEQEMARRALTDPLTGLPNRAAFEREFERMLAQARRSGQKIGVLFMDLDGFKPVNDTYGHQVGDELLKIMAERLRLRVRGSDVPARIGGDEFGVLLWNVESEEAMGAVAQEIIESINRPVPLDACDCEVGVSVGGALFPIHGDVPSELIRRADEAMYMVKQGGRNAYRLWAEGMADAGDAHAGPRTEAVGEEEPAPTTVPETDVPPVDAAEAEPAKPGEAGAQDSATSSDPESEREDAPTEAPAPAEPADTVKDKTDASGVPRGDDSLSLLKPIE